MQSSFGSLNGAVIGALMKDAVRRVIQCIRHNRFDFKQESKGLKEGGGTDWVTNADRLAQEIYVKLLHEWFPTFGIVAEENDLSVPCTEPSCHIWFSVDPLDGTSAFVRRQSDGIGTMLALMIDERVIAVCIGDVMTGEMYYYRPDSEKTHRIDLNGSFIPLCIDPTRTLKKQNVLLRDPVEMHSPSARELLRLSPNPIFKSHLITNGSIGISMAKLWKGEVGAVILPPGKQTPWDSCPIIGITQRLGFTFFNLDFDSHTGTRSLGAITNIPALNETWFSAKEWLVIHKSRTKELLANCEAIEFNITFH